MRAGMITTGATQAYVMTTTTTSRSCAYVLAGASGRRTPQTTGESCGQSRKKSVGRGTSGEIAKHLERKRRKKDGKKRNDSSPKKHKRQKRRTRESGDNDSIPRQKPQAPRDANRSQSENKPLHMNFDVDAAHDSYNKNHSPSRPPPPNPHLAVVEPSRVQGYSDGMQGVHRRRRARNGTGTAAGDGEVAARHTVADPRFDTVGGVGGVAIEPLSTGLACGVWRMVQVRSRVCFFV